MIVSPAYLHTLQYEYLLRRNQCVIVTLILLILCDRHLLNPEVNTQSHHSANQDQSLPVVQLNQYNSLEKRESVERVKDVCCLFVCLLRCSNSN